MIPSFEDKSNELDLAFILTKTLDHEVYVKSRPVCQWTHSVPHFPTECMIPAWVLRAPTVLHVPLAHYDTWVVPDISAILSYVCHFTILCYLESLWNCYDASA
mmetsp:Transcript_44128/g.128469  ORF Transcript_44128/g.128469 Transcript_44128/m.128469 type:complete len:103 (+) Transcript_44128:147-455(+)